MKKLFWISLFLIFAGFSTGIGQTSNRADGMRFVPNVQGQFQALSERPEAMGMHLGLGPDPSTCKHYQAMQRVDGADGTPFFLMTRSGNAPLPGALCNDSPNEYDNGHLIIFKMGSRDKTGERLRSNRLRKGLHVDSTLPSAEDAYTQHYTVVGGDPNDPVLYRRPGLILRDGPGSGRLSRSYQHPGGMQLVGNILAVALEAPADPSLPPTSIMFFDVTDPEAPRFKSQFIPVHLDEQPFQVAGFVGITPLANGLYLMAVGSNNDEVHFFRSTIGDLASPDLEWRNINYAVRQNSSQPQTLQFIREGNIDGDLYMAGVHGNPKYDGDDDRIDLFKVACETAACELGEQITMTTVNNRKRMSPYPIMGGSRHADGAAASGYHISPTGELILYGTTHDNDGPADTIKFGEWRHEEIVRPGSPTYTSSTSIQGGLFGVDEGSTVNLSASVSATSPKTKAWIQLYHGIDFKFYNVTVDYPDYAKDDFNNFWSLELWSPPSFFTHSNRARSWRWYAPPGCSINATTTAGRTRTMTGDGNVQRDADLFYILDNDSVDNVNVKIGSVAFVGDCDGSSPANYIFEWDTDRNGSYETTGTSISFNSAGLDGNSNAQIPVQARPVAGGATIQGSVMVTIRNVAPTIFGFYLLDSSGNTITSQVPYVLTGRPVDAIAGFTDPGRLDRQTAKIVWGDGAIDTQASFIFFTDAYQGQIGAARDRHAYTTAGTFPFTLSVTDDDGGVSTQSSSVRVLTPAQAVIDIISRIDAIYGSTTNNNTRKDLEKARKALAGNPNGSNGALEKIRNQQYNSARTFLRKAIGHLEDARVRGATVGVPIELLEEVKLALPN